MKDQIELNDGVYIDLPKLIYSRLLIQANSGGGKSWAIRRILEQSHGKVQQIIIDSEGEFGTLREKHDYILAGKDGDTPADPRSAALLARKLLEIGVSAIIDLYELHPQDRKRFVKEFLNGMINAPKELWHECIVVVDEAHIYAPEKGQSEAMDAVIGLMSLGRKRGFCGILATQRISKLHKDAAAECNNKLIGRTGLDIDMKRAAEELGFTSKEQMQSLRKLKPGEFYAFGTALSDEVVSITVGAIETSHPKAGKRGFGKVTPPTPAIKKILNQLGDLPQEAKKEAQTMQELKDEIILLKRQKKDMPQKIVEIDLEKSLEPHLVAFRSVENAYKNKIENYEIYINNLFANVRNFMMAMRQFEGERPSQEVGASYAPEKAPLKPIPMQSIKKMPDVHPTIPSVNNDSLSNPEKRILDAIAWLHSIGVDEPEQTAVAFLAGYTIGGGAFNNPKGSLRTKGLVEYRGSKIVLTETGNGMANVPAGNLDSEQLQAMVLDKLPTPEKKILTALISQYPDAISNELLAEMSGYVAGGGAFNNPKGRLRSLGLIEYPQKGFCKARDILFID